MQSLKKYLKNPAQLRKAGTAFVSCVLLGVTSHVLPSAVGEWLNVLQPILVTYGVWQVPNEPAPAEAAPAPEPVLPTTPPAA